MNLVEPNEFLTSATSYDVSCYQEIDGSIASSFVGGTAPLH